MRVLKAAELLNVWERTLGQPPMQRALILLATAEEKPITALEQLSIGQRDSLLLTLRAQTFGEAIAGVACCPHCNEYLELNFNVADIRTDGEVSSEPLVVTEGSYEVRFRLPNSADLRAVARANDPATAREYLLDRCMLSGVHDGAALTTDQLPFSIVEAVTQRMAQADPQANIELELSCPACAHGWTTQFDIVSFFWNELTAWARRLLREVHQLAHYYGWREADILNMSALRRQLYLQMIGEL